MPEIKLNVGGVTLTVPSENLTQGIEKGEFTIDSTDLVVKQKSDYDVFIANIDKEAYNRGKLSGLEMPLKEARDKHGLTFEGKTIDNFAEALRSKIIAEAKIEPSKQISELTADKEKLQAIAKEWESKHNTLLTSFEGEKKNGRIERELLSKLPKDGLTIPSEDLLLILKSRNEFDIEGENIVIKRGGELVKNPNTLNPVSLEELLPELIKPYIIARKGGMGEGNNADDKAGTIEGFMKEMQTKGVSENSSAFNIELAKRMKEGTLKL
jgi:hypothetical protein